MVEERYMRRAIDLAKLGLGSVSPNPAVGCVIVHDDQIIGEGFHRAYGSSHAEVNAIVSVENPSLLSQSTAYVTLEPCAHHGKTPPCADLLVAKNLKRVVIATGDPTSKVGGKGIKKLQDAGIEVVVGVLKKEAEYFNRRFLVAYRNQRPYIILKWAQTYDGFVARENYDSKWISNSHSRKLVHKWRSEEDAILVGKNTALYDNPQLTTRSWKGKHPVRILLDTNLEITASNKIFSQESETIVFNCHKDGSEKNISWVKINSRDIDFILQELFKRQLHSIIIEGGSAIIQSFIEKNMWDEARVFTSPTKFGAGITSPKLRGSIIHEQRLEDDLLQIISNG